MFGIFTLCASYSDKLNIKWLNNGYDVYFQNKLTLNTTEGNLFSIVPITDLINVTIEGAKWELNGIDIPLGSSNTLRNQSKGNKIKIKIEGGKAATLVKT